MVVDPHSRVLWSHQLHVSWSQLCLKVSIGILVVCCLLILGYTLFGHGFVGILYRSDLSIVREIMSGRENTPFWSYLEAADEAMLKVSVGLAVTAFALFLARDVFGLALSVMSILVCSLSLFLLLDEFPPLAGALHLDLLPYYSWRAKVLPDPELGFRQRPLSHSENGGFRGWAYSAQYGIDEPAETVVIETDEDGFRNQPGRSSADIVILGSSFPVFGNDLEDTYAKKLEKHLNGPIVANLAVGGYGPVEFLKAFKRFGLRKKPRFAILAFNVTDPTLLKVPGAHQVSFVRNLRLTLTGSVWRRWRLASQQAYAMLSAGAWTALRTTFRSIVGTDESRPHIHPDLALLRLPGKKTEPILFPTRHTGFAPDDLLDSPQWHVFENILISFKHVSEQNHIVPILAYIPFATDIYAPYTTLQSGRNWLHIREGQIATSGNDELAAQRLADRVGVELISFLPAFKAAAREGKVVYHRFDDHWNSAGSEIAARVTASVLQARLKGAPSSRGKATAGIGGAREGR